MENLSDTSQATAPAATSADAEKRQRLDEAAKAARERRALKKSEKLLKLEKRKANVAKVKPSSGDQAATSDEGAPVDRNGWPAPEVVAANVPGATQFIRSMLPPPLLFTRYGQALEVRDVDVPQEDGSTKKVKYDPIATNLAPGVAAMMASGGSKLSPGWSIVAGLAVIMIPVGIGHAVEAAFSARDRAEKRRLAAEEKAAQLRATQPAERAPAVPRLVNGAEPKAAAS